MTSSHSSLVVNKLCKRYSTPASEVCALQDVSFSASKGEVVAFHGASGGGKSTLLYALAGLLTPDSGEIVLDGKRLTSLRQSARAAHRAQHIGLVFQDFRLIAYLSVLENVMLANPNRKKAEEALSQLGLMKRIHHLPNQLSGGEQQRCAMARALANDPSLILADEPTGNLDAENSAILLDYLRQVAHSGRIVILATHDPLAVKAADRSIHLDDGKIQAASQPIICTAEKDR